MLLRSDETPQYSYCSNHIPQVTLAGLHGHTAMLDHMYGRYEHIRRCTLLSLTEQLQGLHRQWETSAVPVFFLMASLPRYFRSPMARYAFCTMTRRTPRLSTNLILLQPPVGVTASYTRHGFSHYRQSGSSVW